MSSQISSTNNFVIRSIKKISLSFGIWPVTEDLKVVKRTWQSIVIFFLLAVRLGSHTVFLFTHSSAALSVKGITFLWIINAASDQFRMYRQAFGNGKLAKLLKSFFEKNHLSKLKLKDEYSIKVLDKTEKQARIIYIVYMVLMSLSFSIPIVDDILANYLSGGFSSSSNVTIVNTMNMAVPMDVETNVANWFLLCFVYSILNFFELLILIPIQDFMLFYMALHEVAHWRILKNRILNIVYMINNSDKLQAGGSLENKIYENLKECIKYHNCIMKFHKEMHIGYSFIFKLVYFMVTMYSCFTTLMLTDPRTQNTNKYATLLAATYIYLFSWSVFFSQLTHCSGEIGEVAYSLPWHCMSKRCRQALAIMIMRAQRPVVFPIFGSIETSLQTMVQIVKGSYSVYATLSEIK